MFFLPSILVYSSCLNNYFLRLILRRRPNITWAFLLQAFISGLLGGSLFCNLFYASIELTSPVFVSAIDNLVPAMTIVIAILFRSEKLSLHKVSGKAKSLGTIICVTGAMVMTFYKGRQLPMWSFKIHFLHHTTTTGSHEKLQSGNNFSLGIILALRSSFCYALWTVLLEKIGNDYPCHYSSAAWMSLMGAIQSTIFALCFDHESNQWKLGWSIRLFIVLYMGVLGSGIVVILMTWCSQKRGPLFVSIFNPMTLIFVALASAMLLDEAVYVGSVIGGGLIIAGLYLVLWGKEKERKALNQSSNEEATHNVEGI
ncbi:WAT1-related protein At1g25270-like [Nicotiana tomentosiformis]|uniref:WAT1-related protein At1g25270-like n=1 Tax=Nicotiana tomentosiformis TaxID=4098 RepID=UPI000878177C|nr:WAT1-related protein At1g25270-like [Nicotiana tomentosiformis]